jgi:hypothetical protein
MAMGTTAHELILVEALGRLLSLIMGSLIVALASASLILGDAGATCSSRSSPMASVAYEESYNNIDWDGPWTKG